MFWGRDRVAEAPPQPIGHAHVDALAPVGNDAGRVLVTGLRGELEAFAAQVETLEVDISLVVQLSPQSRADALALAPKLCTFWQSLVRARALEPEGPAPQAARRQGRAPGDATQADVADDRPPCDLDALIDAVRAVVPHELTVERSLGSIDLFAASPFFAVNVSWHDGLDSVLVTVDAERAARTGSVFHAERTDHWLWRVWPRVRVAPGFDGRYRVVTTDVGLAEARGVGAMLARLNNAEQLFYTERDITLVSVPVRAADALSLAREHVGFVLQLRGALAALT